MTRRARAACSYASCGCSKTFDVRVEGSLVQDDYVSGAPGQCKRLGPWTVSVTDGTLNLTTY